MLTLGGEKMAKSKGHFVTLAELFGQHRPLAVRFHLLRSHYRSVADFSEESLEASTQGLARLEDTYRLLAAEAPASSPADGGVFTDYRRRFEEAMNDDLNTPQAIAALFDAAREVNRLVAASPDPRELAGARQLFDELLVGVLGVRVSAEQGSDNQALLRGLLDMVLDQRQESRRRRDFAAADAIRERLAKLGITIEDTPKGSRWKVISK